MKWKDSFDNKRADDQPEEDYLDEETYSPWKKKSPGDFLSKWFGKSTAPYILVFAGVLILVVGLWSVFSGAGGNNSGGQIKALDERITQLEEKLGKMESALENVSRIDALEKKNSQLKGRFDRMEAALALRMDHISKKLDGLKPKATVKSPAKPVVKTAAKPVVQTTPTPPKKTPMRYHFVKTGDTLYSISRQYGITQDKLRRLNNLSGETIKLGQKLRVGPANRP